MTPDIMEKCSRFESCSKNFCPLDQDLQLRSGKKSERCRYMREPKAISLAGRQFISGGTAMPDVPLKFVPSGNLKCLNQSSQEKWKELENL
jgi:hypothetical protein